MLTRAASDAVAQPATANRILAVVLAANSAQVKRDLQPVPLVRGQVLFDAGDMVDIIYFPVSGIVSLILPITRKNSEVAIVGREGFVGVPAYLGQRKSRVTALVQYAGFAYVLPVTRVTAAAHDPALGRHLHRYVEAFVSTITQTAGCRAMHSVEQQLARWLLMYSDRIDGKAFHITHKTLADMMAVRRSTITNAACSLQSRAAIEYNHGRVEITDRAALQRAACECYTAIKRIENWNRSNGKTSGLRTHPVH